MYKNIDKQTALKLKDLVEYQKGQVVSKTLVQNDHVSMTIFSFDKGEEISRHTSCPKIFLMPCMAKNNLRCSSQCLFKQSHCNSGKPQREISPSGVFHILNQGGIHGEQISIHF